MGAWGGHSQDLGVKDYRSSLSVGQGHYVDGGGHSHCRLRTIHGPRLWTSVDPVLCVQGHECL